MAKLISKIVTIDTKKTSIRLAKPEWDAIDIISKKENIRRNYLIELLNQNKNTKIGLTNSIRLFSIIYLYHETMSLQLYEKNYQKTSSITEAIKGII
ncbi:MAG: ribbon-helix-helix domain-containing protein [Alphaproteobacteria bacterium]|nr:ribbon-helix-helix domain-containing protein [Alphaproteobacteria bacterium]